MRNNRFRIGIFESADVAARNAVESLIEEGHTVSIDKKWSARFDPPHHSKMKPHVHILFKDKDVCVVNRDGTMSHNTKKDAVPNWVLRDTKIKKFLSEASTSIVSIRAVPESTMIHTIRTEHRRYIRWRIRQLQLRIDAAQRLCRDDNREP